MTTTRCLFVLIFLVLATGAARAQVANPAAPARAASVGLGFDHGGVLEAGYRQPVDAVVPGSLHVRLQVPSVPGLGEGGVDVGVTAGRVGAHGWGATATVAAALRWVDGELLGLADGAAVVGAAAGYFRPRGLVAIEAAWEHSVVTYVRPTARYRRLVYMDAASGVHGGGGGTLRAGVTASVRATRDVEVSLRAGYVTTEALNAAPGLPFYAVLAAAVRF